MTPKEYYFIGTNDEECKSDSNWEVLCEKHKIHEKDGLGCKVEASKDGPKKYQCLGLKILATGNNKRAALSSLKIFSSDVCY